MKVKGSIHASVWVECPHCWVDFDAMELESEEALTGALFGAEQSPAKWKDVEIEVQCPSCRKVTVIGELVW